MSIFNLQRVILDVSCNATLLIFVTIGADTWFSQVIPYTQNNWRIKYLANQSKIVVGVTLIWRKDVAVSKNNS